MTPIASRRQLLIGALATSIALPAFAQDASKKGLFAKRGLPIGVQLYTVTDAARTDLDGTFGKLKAMGFETIELAGYHGHTPAALRSAADKHGLRFTAIHLQGQSFGGADPALDGDLAKVAADMRTLGITKVAMPLFRIPATAGAPRAGEDFGAYLGRVGQMLDADYWKAEAAFLNKVGAGLKREGIRFGYHNHNIEYAPIGNTNGMEILLKETDRDVVMFELDAGWVAAAGLDPVAELSKYPSRFEMMHVKDIKASTKPNFTLQQDPTQVGDGTINWSKLIPAAMKAGVTDFFVEQEPPFQMDRFAALQRSIAYLHKL